MSAVDSIAKDLERKDLLGATDQAAWEDISKLLATAAKELKMGEMVHFEDFNLFDSMSALELMDPKMDSGILIDGKPLANIAERLKMGLIPLSFSSAKDVLASIDFLFRCECAWLQGQSLSYTFMTCGYLYPAAFSALLDAALDAAVDAQGSASVENMLLGVWSAMVAAFVRTNSLLREVIVRADIYEEEDFSSSSFDVRVTEKASEETVQCLLQQAEKVVQHAVSEHKASLRKKSSKKNAKKSHTASSSDKGVVRDADQAVVSLSLLEAFLVRIQYRKTVLDAFNGLGPERKVDFEKSQKAFLHARDIISNLETENLELDKAYFSGKVLGYDPHLSRLVASNSPPREVTLLPMEGAVTQQRALLDQLIFACSPGDLTSIDDLRAFLSAFSMKRPNIVARSYVLVFLYMEKQVYGKFNFVSWLNDSMVMNGVPAVLLSTQEGIEFSNRCIECVYESLKLLLQNRSRQRARIEALLADWAVLQMDASMIDEHFIDEMGIPNGTGGSASPRYFTAWTLEMTSLLMIQYLFLGFELDLYSETEYKLMYWYLDYLLGSRLQNLAATWSFVEKMNELLETASTDSKKNKKRSKKNKAKSSEQAVKKRFLREKDTTELLRVLVRASFQCLSAVNSKNERKPGHGSERIRFDHRIAPFQQVRFPSLLTFDDYERNSDFSAYKPRVILKSAEECFKLARSHVENLLQHDPSTELAKEAQTLARVSITNCISLTRAVASSEDQQDFRAHYDFSMHPHFPLVKFDEVKS